jgi:hypothetical protein
MPAVVTNKLSSVITAAARLVSGRRKFDHVSEVLMDLHWLPVPYRILFEINLFVFKAINGIAPAPIATRISLQPRVRSTRSVGALRLAVPSDHPTGTAKSAFTYSAPAVWNELPIAIRTSASIAKFKTALKSYYFNLAYCK